MEVGYTEEKSLWELVLHYGLFLGGIFQLICILAIVVVPSNRPMEEEDILQEKDSKSRKLLGQATPQSTQSPRLRERKKKR